MRRWDMRDAGFVVALTSSIASAQGPTATPRQQTDAWVVTAHVKARMLDAEAPDTLGPIEWALVRVLRSGPLGRIDFTRDPAAGVWGGGRILPIGVAWLSADTSTKGAVILLDSARKEFIAPDLRGDPVAPWIFRPFHPPGDTTRRPSPNDPASRVLDVTVTIDSVGAGPTLLGHPTLHYHQTQRATVQTTVGTMFAVTVKLEDEEDLDIATDIPDAPPVDGVGVQCIAAFPAELAMAPQFAAAVRAAATRYPRGLILHMDGRRTIGSSLGPLTRLMTMDVDHWERSPVDASLFTIPRGYSRGSPEAMR